MTTSTFLLGIALACLVIAAVYGAVRHELPVIDHDETGDPDFDRPRSRLLGSSRFAPLFAVQFLGAFNDNLMRYAALFLASFGAAALPPAQAAGLATLSVGLFIAPYFVLSGLSGQIADAVDKRRVVMGVKYAEVAIMTIAALGIASGSIPTLMLCVLLMGCHSTVFGPVKYAILPQHLHRDELVHGTALVEAGTFVAILAGQLVAAAASPRHAATILVAAAILGLAASMLVPSAPPRGAVRIDANPIRSTVDSFREAKAVRGAWLSILGISWFFSLGAVLLAQFAPLVAGTIGGGERVVTLFLVIFSVGVALGSLHVGRRLRGEVSARFVPGAALALSGFLLVLWQVTAHWGEPIARAADMLRTPGGIVCVAALAGIAFSGGVFVVPLYAVLQTSAPADGKARAIAANNVVNAAVTVLMVAVVGALSACGVGVPGLVGALGFATLAVALVSCWLLPETVFKSLVRALLRALYRVEVVGAENMPAADQAAVVVVNHVSFLDGVLIGAFLPGRPVFAVNTRIARSWWIRPALMLFDAFPVDPTNPMSAKAMVKAVRDEGRTLVIFPEGRITTTGALMKIYDGPGMVAAKADAPVVPIRIDGAQYTPFSRMRGKLRLRTFPRIRLTVLEPRRFAVAEEGSARERRKAAGRELYDRMSAMMQKTSGRDQTIFSALCDAAAIHGRRSVALEDVRREPLSYGSLLARSLILGRRLSEGTRPGEIVGLLLPNVNASAVALFGLQDVGRVPAMLNYTAGLAALGSACDTARIRTIVTSRAFVEQAKLGALVEGLSANVDRVVWLEDLAPLVGTVEKLRGLLSSFAAKRIHERRGIRPGDPALILFTSGSEGVPKAVVLSHRNVLANCRQLAARVDFNPSDVVLNALPVFHSFGLTGGLLLPVLNGVKVFLYPSPLHYRIVPAVAYDANATIMFGTDTFLAGYARMANPYDFHSIRYVFAGAERVKPETRQAFMDRFGLRILEGYGATETSPVIAVNTPMHFRAGTVGRPLPGVETRLDPVPGIEEGGRLHVRGPNVMLGYYLASRPGALVPPDDGWHDTGDIVTIDGEGFIEIKGRAKRFAKIGGEMVSLTAVEAGAAKVWPDAASAAVSRPDARKGEQIVVFTTAPGATTQQFAAWARANGVAELAVPKEVRVIDALPVLGTGKTDYVTLDRDARS